MACARGCCPSPRDHYKSIRLGAKATPTKASAQETIATEERQKRWDRDMPAYARLRAEGLQPPQIDGSAELEAKARSKTEVEMGEIMEGEGKRFAEVNDMIQTGEKIDVKELLTSAG